jgi:S1-C subfamily serine protease
MTLIDWAIVILAVVFASVGYRRGLLVAALGLVGFAGGAVLGSRLAPSLLDEGSSSPYAPAIALLGGLLLGGLLAILLESVAMTLHRRFFAGRVSSSIDAAGGAVLFVGLALAISWVAGALALNAPALKGIRADVQQSTILGAVNEVMPPSGPILNVLNRIGTLPELQGPSADVPPPDDAALDDPDVRRASDSVVHVLGSACGLNLSGSGWAAGPELVVTNAHVVAGVEDPYVRTRAGTEHDAYAVLYRPEDDIAVLRVPGLAAEPLALSEDPAEGEKGAVLGFPGTGEFSSTAARLGTTGSVTSQDSYGRGPIEREMTSFRAEVIAGNSGGPVVGLDGEVLTTVFAATVDSSRPEGLGIPNAIVSDQLQRTGGRTGTGSCT